MARMHSRKKGRSGSTRPVAKTAPKWAGDKKKINEIILSLSKRGKGQSEIGARLRDQYGIPSVKAVTGKSLGQILKELKLNPELPEDLQSLVKQAVSLDAHLTVYKNDLKAKRSLQLTESKIKRLVKYYKRKNRLPGDWKYDITKAKLLVG